jgi:hypothetical protein
MHTDKVLNITPAVNSEPSSKPALRIVGWKTRVQATLQIEAPTEHAALALAAQLVGGEEVIDGVDQLVVRGRQVTIAGTFTCETQPDEIVRLIEAVSRHQFTDGRA